MPTAPGVYIFKDAAGQVLYIGKAKSLKNRVRSYFYPTVDLGPKTSTLVNRIHSLATIQVNSEAEALLLESRLIKKFLPPFNSAGRDDKSPYYIHLTREPFPKPVINHQPHQALAGPFLNSLVPRRLLHYFRRIAPYCSAPRPVKSPCFYSHLNLCSPCPGSRQPQIKRQYQKNISRLKRLLRGNFAQVKSQLTQEMSVASKNLDFEKAAIWRNYLRALTTLLSSPLSPEEYLVNPNLVEDLGLQAITSLLFLKDYFPYLSSLERIETYDVAHLKGKSTTAAMTVAEKGLPNSRSYRHFKLSTSKGDDLISLSEVLTRRLHRTDWPTPHLIVLDGGKPQLTILPRLSSALPTLPPIIALAKSTETLVIPTAPGFTEINLEKNHPGLKLLMHLRDEAHRFSRRLHHHYQAKTLLGGRTLAK